MTVGEIMTFAEADRRYPDEWVLFEVIDDDDDWTKATGRLLGHSPNRQDLDEPFRRFRHQKPKALVAEHWTGDLVAKGYVAML